MSAYFVYKILSNTFKKFNDPNSFRKKILPSHFRGENQRIKKLKSLSQKDMASW